MANLFKWWVKFNQKKKKTWVTDVIILMRGLNPSSAEICAKSKKRSSPQNTQLTVFNATVWKDKFFFTTLMFDIVFFAKFSKLHVGLKMYKWVT